MRLRRNDLVIYNNQPCYVTVARYGIQHWACRILRVSPPWPLSCGTPYINDFLVQREEVRKISVLERLAYAGEGWDL